MTYEDNYKVLRNEMNIAKAVFELNPFSASAKRKCDEAVAEFNAYCAIVLERLMIDNADVLKRLKGAE